MKPQLEQRGQFSKRQPSDRREQRWVVTEQTALAMRIRHQEDEIVDRIVPPFELE